MTVSDAEIELPDKTMIYRYERAKEVFKTAERPEFTVADVILLLLYAQQDKAIYGRISLMKEVFLLINEVIGENRVQPPKYVPQRFGMYSYFVANTVSNLEYAGFIIRKGKKNTKTESFCISEKGVKYAAEIFQNLPTAMQQKIKESRKGWDQWGREGLLRYVYREYKDYRDLSVLKNRYAPILWGKGKG
ncbi:MAG: hypothetical protein ABSE39_13000 [Candidatus Bathyarchaeia archaeon]|jgi:uncharacterized protein YwgA